MKKLIFNALVVALPLFISKMNAQTPIFTSAKADKAQLYFNGAEIQQTVSVNLPKGASEVVIMNVANHLDEKSIQIKSISSASILSVQFTNQPIMGYDNEYVSQSIRQIRDSIQMLEKDIEKNRILKNATTKSIELLDKNQQLSGGNINTSELSKLLEYYKTKRYELEKQIVTITEEDNKLRKKINALKFRLGTSSSQNADNKGKIILQVLNETAGKVPFQLNYITYQARWMPFYEVRSEKIGASILLKYNASVSQNTGVDWNNVKLSLSSGYINQQTQSPTMYPWFIGIRENVPASPMRKRAAFTKNMETMELSAIEVSKEEDVLEEKSLEELVTIGETQLNVVFDIDVPYNILSNGKKHNVSLKNIEIPATYQYYVAPKYDLGAYLVGNIENYGKYNLLSGEAILIFEGMYVGKTTINPENANEKLKLSLGRDKKIVTERKLISQKTENKSLSSKKTQTFVYEISVQNNKKESVAIDVEDQVPISTEKEIKVSVIESGGAVFDKEKGSLKWKLNLKPNENQKVRFSFQIESDKDVIIENL